MKILIINQYSGNKGDCAVAYFLLKKLLENPKVTEVTLSTSSIKLWRNSTFITNDKIKFIHWGWDVSNFNPHNRIQWERKRIMTHAITPCIAFLFSKGIKLPLSLLRLFTNKDFIVALKEADMVISTGGHHLTTRFSKNLKNELFFDLLVAAMHRKVVCWSQTYGPFNFSSNIMKNACIRLLDQSILFSRDEHSIEEVHKLVPHKEITKTYESVMGLHHVVGEFVPPSKREKMIGVTIYNAEKRTAEEYNTYIKTMAESVDLLITDGYTVKFFPHEKIGAVVDDRATINDIMNISHNKSTILIGEDNDTKEHLKEIAECCLFIGHKTHSIVFALTSATPVIAISYHSKTEDFMTQFGVHDYVIKDSELTSQTLYDKCKKALAEEDKVANLINEKGAFIDVEISKQFSSLIESYV